MTARISSELRILYSLPSRLISVPPYLLTRTRSPFLTSNGTFLPSSSVLPVPRATIIPSVGFSLAESGIMIPPFLVSFSSAGSTRTRSPRGFRFKAIVFVMCVGVDGYLMDPIPPHSPRETNYRQRARSSTRTLPAKSLALFFVDYFCVDNRLVLAATPGGGFGTWFG